MYKFFNNNPHKRNVGDCVIRAVSIALDKEWEQTYTELCLYGYILSDLPSSNYVWGSYLLNNGFEKRIIVNDGFEPQTVEQFCKEHKSGVFVLALSGHAVCVKDGDIYDTWNSSNEVPLYYFERVKNNV